MKQYYLAGISIFSFLLNFHFFIKYNGVGTNLSTSSQKSLPAQSLHGKSQFELSSPKHCADVISTTAKKFSGGEFLGQKGRVETTISTIRLGLRRVDLGILLESLSLSGHGAELGVARGDFAQNIITDWKSCSQYYLVDPYKSASGESVYFNDRSQDSLDAMHENVLKKIHQNNLQHKIRLLRNTSTEAALQIPDNSLDFLYIDALHDRKFVLLDLLTWYKKVKVGGIIAGHDWHDVKGVTGAVLEFLEMFVKGDIALYLTNESLDFGWASYFFVKPTSLYKRDLWRSKFMYTPRHKSTFPDYNNITFE